MIIEEINKYFNHKVKLVCVNSGRDYFWTGRIKEISETSILIKDKYSHDVRISLDSIRSLEDLGVSP